jgi:hypothetical protein
MSTATPDYIVCLECESPCYVFDWDGKQGRVLSAMCEMCGNDGPEAFQVPEDEGSEEDYE